MRRRGARTTELRRAPDCELEADDIAAASLGTPSLSLGRLGHHRFPVVRDNRCHGRAAKIIRVERNQAVQPGGATRHKRWR